MLQSIVDNITNIGYLQLFDLEADTFRPKRILEMRFLLYNGYIFTRAIPCKLPGSFVALAVNDNPLNEMPIFKSSLEPGPVILDLRALAMKLATDPSSLLLLASI